MYFAQNFQIFIVLVIKYPLMTNFIPQPMVTKIVIKGGCFWYLWTAKVHFQSFVVISKDFNRFYQAGVKLAPARVTTSSKSSCGIGLKGFFTKQTDKNLILKAATKISYKSSNYISAVFIAAGLMNFFYNPFYELHISSFY